MAMRPLFPGLLAMLNGGVAVAAAVASLRAGSSMMMGPDPLPAWLLLILGVVVLANGIVLVAGLSIPMRPQGAAMLLYGGLMVVAGAIMITTDLFTMGMTAVSGGAMLVLGALMIVSGLLMAWGRPAPMSPEG